MGTNDSGQAVQSDGLLGIKDMKTQEQWAARVQNSKEPWSKLVAEIQADALQHAADTCQKHANAYKNSSEGFGGGWTVFASEECRALILNERAVVLNAEDERQPPAAQQETP